MAEIALSIAAPPDPLSFTKATDVKFTTTRKLIRAMPG
jgi:hypothetical protein